LRAQGASVVTHNERFPERTPDEVWLRESGRQGWIVLSKDKMIRRRRLELDSIRHHGVAAFFLTSGDLTGADMAGIFVSTLPQMYRLASRLPRPFIATIAPSGAIRLLALG